MEKLWSPEMVDARVWLMSQDFKNAAVLESAYNNGIPDHRLSVIGSYFQRIGRLLNCGVLDEELFGPPLLAQFPLVWRVLKPIAMRIRADIQMPIYSDIEYVVHRYAKGLSTMSLKPYDAGFCKELSIEDLPQQCAQLAADALSAAVKRVRA